mmetsp:Transcript_55114/g.131334  ORF Transcript_55114/g.131334 Transcript_55114/m.131334 type:complete len:591 (-) Transcript_55114:72-1844(-)
MWPIAPKPWKQTAGGLEGPHSRGRGKQWPYASGAGSDAYAPRLIEVEPENSLYESSRGIWVSEDEALLRAVEEEDSAGGSHAQALRRCCVFAPEPQATGARAVASTFHGCKHIGNAAVGAPPPSAKSHGFLRELQQWGFIGAAVAKVFDSVSWVEWALLEHYVLTQVAWLLGLLWQCVVGFACPFRATASPPDFLLEEDIKPMIAWHPHRDVFATLAGPGTPVAVHSIGDAFTGSATEYLREHSNLGCPLTLAWQPFDLIGTLAVGMSKGVALWHRSREQGWRRTWAVRGAPFACSALCWAPDGRSLAAAGADGTVRVWPRGSLLCEDRPWCITLKRMLSGPVTSIRWSPDGAVLAVCYKSGEYVARFWDTRTWEIASQISLGPTTSTVQMGPCIPTPPPSMVWCSSTGMLIIAQGNLFEVNGLVPSSGGMANGIEPTCWPLLVPHVRSTSSTAAAQATQKALEVSVCPRTWQRIAVRVEGVNHILIFERVGAEGWLRQEVVYRGVITALARPDVLGSAAGADAGQATARPLALEFAGNAKRRSSREAAVEGSLLAVLWDFSDRGREIRTYPMYYLPAALVKQKPGMLFQ